MRNPQALLSQLVTESNAVALRVRCDLHHPERRRIALSVPPLDAMLGGGVPCGAITEVFGAPSSGKTTLAHALISSTVRSGSCAAWIDLPNSFYPRRFAERVLWVAPPDSLSALRAAEYVLEAGGFRVVVVDLGTPIPTRAAMPASRWLRMARMAARRDAAIVVLSTANVAGAFATLSLETCMHHRAFAGRQGPCPVFEGVASSLYLRKHKYDVPAASSADVYASVEM